MRAHAISEVSNTAYRYIPQPPGEISLFGKDDPETLGTAISAEYADNVPDELIFAGTGMVYKYAEKQMIQGSKENHSIAVVPPPAATAASDNDPTTIICSITSAIKLPMVLTSMTNIANNDPVCMAHHADVVLPMNMVSIACSPMMSQ